MANKDDVFLFIDGDFIPLKEFRADSCWLFHVESAIVATGLDIVFYETEK